MTGSKGPELSVSLTEISVDAKPVDGEEPHSNKSGPSYLNTSAAPSQINGKGMVDEAARFTMSGLFRFCGTGFLAAVAFLDPGNLEADILVGVGSRFALLWWYGLCTLCFGFAFQALSGKLGLVTGTDLAYHVGQSYPRNGRLLLWVLLEMSLLAADVQETVGCALAVQILSGGAIPLWAGCLLVSAAAFAMLQLDRIGFRLVEACYGILIGLEAIALGMGAIATGAPAAEVALGLVPSLSPNTIIIAAGAMGALVMPYNTFFQSHVVNGRPRDCDTDEKKGIVIKYMKIETFFMLTAAFVINIFAVVIFANFSETADADNIGLASAGNLIYETFGRTVLMMWAIGLLSSGLVATLALTYAGQIIMVGLLGIKVQATWRMMATRLVALLPCLTLAVVFEATNTFDTVAQTINIVQSLVLPFGLIPAIQMTASEKVMGAQWASVNWVTVSVSLITLAVFGVNVFTLIALMQQELPQTPAVMVGFSLLIVLYCALVAYFAVGPNRWPKLIRRGRSTAHTLFLWLKTNRRWADIESMLEVHF